MGYMMTGLADALRDSGYGLKVAEVEGWQSRGFNGLGVEKIVGTMHHHTATFRGAFNGNHQPTLGMCTYGRAGLAGPLCHLLFARDGTVWVVAAGWANHAGTGKWTDVPWHGGNSHTIGIEYESSGIAPWDWTAEQLYWAPRLGAALRDIFGHQNDMSHAEYSDIGKIDTAGWPGGWDGLRAQITAVQQQEEDDMFSAEDRERLMQVHGAVARLDKQRDVVKATHDRIMGRDQQRWYNPKNTGEVSFDAKPGWIAARSSDVHDVMRSNDHVTNSTQAMLNAVAASQRALLEALGKMEGVDPELIEGMRVTLDEQLRATTEAAAADLRAAVSNLSVTLTATPPKETTT